MTATRSVKPDLASEYTAVLDHAAGGGELKAFVRRAVDTVLALGVPQRLRAVKERNAGTRAKPYLHALGKGNLVKLAYGEVLSSVARFPAKVGALYLHFPFCTKHCTHCHYYKQRSNSNAEWQEFPRFLIKELDLILRSFGICRLNAETIHFGGGTPSLINEAS